MNTLMLIGLGILGLTVIGMIVAFFRFHATQAGKAPRIIAILLCFALLIAAAATYQTGHVQNQKTLTEAEVSLLESGRDWADFSQQEQELAAGLTTKIALNTPEVYERYLPVVLDWKVAEYIAEHPIPESLVEEEVRASCLKNLEEKRSQFVK